MKSPGPIIRLVSVSWWLVVLTACSGGGGGQGSSLPVDSVSKYAVLSGDQVSPPVSTGAGGVASLTVDVNSGTVSGSVTVSGVTATAVELSDSNPAGGMAKVALIESGSGSGVWSIPAAAPVLTATQIADFLAGKLTFRIISAANPGGEIQGDAVLASPIVTRYAAFSGAQEVPAVITAADAAGTLAVDIVSGSVTGSITVTGLTVTGAELRDGDAGTSGTLVQPMVRRSPTSTIWDIPASRTLSAGQIARFNAGKLYFNALSVANPTGETRGQINRSTPAQMVNQVSFSSQVQPIFNQSCALNLCHSTGGISPFSLSSGVSYSRLVNVNAESTAGQRVVPGDSTNSVLYLRISGTSLGLPQMPLGSGPLGSTPLSVQDQNLIRLWIDQGAQDN